MWAQLIRTRLKPGKDNTLEGIFQRLRDSEQPGSGLIRSTLMRDQQDPSAVYMLVVFESEAKAREREGDQRREPALRDVRAAMADAYEGAPTFVDLNVVEEFAHGDSAARTRDNVALAGGFIDEVVNKGNIDIVDDLFAPDFVEHEELPPGIPSGRDGVKVLFTQLHAAFPDVHAEIDQATAQDDRVVLMQTWSGTHTGDFLGIPATGKQVSFTVFDIIRIAHGKFVEHWGMADMMSLMQQINPMPVPGSVG